MLLRHLLSCHPAGPAPFVDSFQIEVSMLPGGAIRLNYLLEGEMARLRVQPRRPGNRVDGLWLHTCFELFVGEAGMPAYREFNFSPSGQWQAYAFHGYRHGGLLMPASAPDMALSRSPDRLAMNVRLPSANLPPGPRLRLGLCAVIEATDGGLSYWALRHPPGKPDFHHPDTFALEIDLQESRP